jgi:transcriptional regulator with XRE-family HTH domain
LFAADRSGDPSGEACDYIVGDIEGLTQPELAAAAKIATTTLRGIERADAALTDINDANLAGELGITVEEYRAAYQRARRNTRVNALRLEAVDFVVAVSTCSRARFDYQPPADGLSADTPPLKVTELAMPDQLGSLLRRRVS